MDSLIVQLKGRFHHFISHDGP